MRFGPMKSALLAAASFGIAALSATGAVAAPKEGQIFGDWIITCPSGAKECRIQQGQKAENGGRLFEISFGKVGTKGEFGFVTRVPLGSRLQPGVALLVDGKQIAAPYIQCMPDGCQAAAQLTADQVKALAKSKELLLGIADGTGRTVTLVISPKGLGDGLNAIQ
jgi:invasion protein IalB